MFTCVGFLHENCRNGSNRIQPCAGALITLALNALAYLSALVQQHRLARPHLIEVGKMGKFFPT
jgi:hypothetical protein